METCSYEQVHCGTHEYTRDWRPFLRQLAIATGTWTYYFTYGLCMGTPTVLVPYVRREANSTEAVSKEMASWLSSAFSFSALPWVIAISIIVRFYGNKKPFLFVTLTSTVSLIVFVTSQSMTQVLFSNILQGPLVASCVTLCFQVLTEYTSPKYRGFFLTVKSASFFWGIWVANAIGTFYHWKNIAIVGFMCMSYNFASLFIWCESPYWLAKRGRFEECTDIFYWLKGVSEESRQELTDLINKEKERLTRQTHNENQIKKYILSIHKTLLSKEVYKPLLISILLLELFYICGKYVCSVYAIDIFKRISGEASAYRGMLILDGVTVFSMYIGCALSRILKRRTLLFSATSLGVMFLLLMSLYLYLIKLEIIEENSYISLMLLSAFSLCVCCGPIIISTSISAELMPLKARTTSFCLTALSAKATVACLVKLSPYLFDSCGMHGTFLCYAIGTSITLLLLYLYMPETKDKTLQEIADSLKLNSKVNTKETKQLIVIKKEESHYEVK